MEISQHPLWEIYLLAFLLYYRQVTVSIAWYNNRKQVKTAGLALYKGYKIVQQH